MRNRFQTATATAANTNGTHNNRISAQTVGNCLCEGGLSARRPYVGYVLARLHIVNRVNWAHTHQRWLKQQLNSVLFSDESRFSLPFVEVMAGFEYTVGEMSVIPSYADCSVLERDGFGGGHSVLVWEGIAHAHMAFALISSLSRGI